MAWWNTFLRLFSEAFDPSTDDPLDLPVSPFRKALREFIFDSTVDVAYFILSIWTYLYVGFVSIAFFAKLNYPILLRLLDSLSEPYLGAVGVYVIIKEIRKKRQRIKGQHFGEFFVIFWILIFFAAIVMTLVSPDYSFDDVMSLILTNALAVFVIYIGGIIHR